LGPEGVKASTLRALDEDLLELFVTFDVNLETLKACDHKACIHTRPEVCLHMVFNPNDVSVPRGMIRNAGGGGSVPIRTTISTRARQEDSFWAWPDKFGRYQSSVLVILMDWRELSDTLGCASYITMNNLLLRS
jgi:hypothetical protein